MAQHVNKLNALKLAKLTEPGMYADGNGLYLQVTSAAGRSWIFRYQRHGKERQMGLGSLRDVSLTQVRLRVRRLRDLLLSNVDPIDHRRAERVMQRLRQLKAVDFESCAKSYIESHSSGWTNSKHRQQWERTLATYAFPVIGSSPVNEIETALILEVLRPIWTTKTETALRLRERIERVLSWATVQGYREGSNPARWKGHLEELLPKPSKVKKVTHHAALPFGEVPEFIKRVREQPGIAARAVELTILTACRTSEVIEAQWSEFDLNARVWTIPAHRMKAGKEHRVPLSPNAQDLLKTLRGLDAKWVLPGARPNKPLSNMAMLAVLKRMKRRDVTMHGFRSAFRDWVSEKTNYPREVAEMALAHAIGSAVESAYRRGDLFEKRVDLMLEWAAFCEAAPFPTHAPTHDLT